VFSYTLLTARSTALYVPLTSCCNSHTLPVTRGPNFLLPPEAVASLCRVRDAEMGTAKWNFWCRWLDSQEGPQRLPPPDAGSYVPALRPEGNESADGTSDRRPTVDELCSDIDLFLKRRKQQEEDDCVIVIAGEGEPTLRLTALLQLLDRIESGSRFGTDAADNAGPNPTVRIVTNGLLSADKRQQLFARHQDQDQQQGSACVTYSVALMTADTEQYEVLMHPAASTEAGGAAGAEHGHALVQGFIRCAVESSNCKVEVTAVSRPDVDRAATEALARELGVVAPVRWRRYFP
jgi:hypothetical protein